MKKLITAALTALAMLAVTPAAAHHVTWHYDHPSGHTYIKVKNAVICMRIDTGTPQNKANLAGDYMVAMTVYYHNADGNWQEWHNDSTKHTLWKDNTTGDSNRYAWNCSEPFEEAWVRKGHEAMYAYVGMSKQNNRPSKHKYAHWDSHPYEVNMYNHAAQANARFWCFVAGYNKKNVPFGTDYVEWWLHLKKISGQGC